MHKLIYLFFVQTSLLAFNNVLLIGDSLSAGYGIDKNDAYPKLVEQMMQKTNPKFKIYNGSVSGSTTSSLMSRLKWFERTKPELVIFALGANDGLRGIDTKLIKDNLEQGILYSLKKNRKVLLAGMMMPPNYGKQYNQKYSSLFKELVKKHEISFIPFLLEGVAGNKLLNQRDGIHPNEAGHKIMAETIKKKLLELEHAKN